MKKLLIILLFIPYSLLATNYHFANNGDDATGNGSIATPYQTISKVNSLWTAGTFAAGDSVCFKRGDLFYGTITVKESGSSGNNITIGAYGTGNKPIISGFTTISGWTDETGGIYSKTISAESFTNNIVTVNGVNVAMGRWPNGNTWRTYTSPVWHAEGSTFVDATLSDSPDWAGSEVVMRMLSGWYLVRNNLISNISGVVTQTPGTGASGSSGNAGHGYFIQDNLQTLDSLTEWYYDGTTLFMYFGVADPTDYTVKISTLDKLLTGGTYTSSSYDFITVDNITFQGSSISAMDLAYWCDGWKIQNCTFNYHGKNAISSYVATNTKIVNNIIKNTNNNGIALNWGGTGYGNTIRNNVLDSIGSLIGMMYSDDNGADGIALRDDGLATDTYDTITYNRITNVGHSGMRASLNNYYIKNNYINKFALIKMDAGGIYFYNGTNITIEDNIILNGYGQSGGGIAKSLSYGLPTPPNLNITGIYMDDNSSYMTITGNTSANNRDGGLFLLNSDHNTITYNTFYNNGYYAIGLGDELYGTDHTQSTRDNVITNNIFFAKGVGHATYAWRPLSVWAISTEVHALNDIPLFATWDYNIHTRPLDEDDLMRGFLASGAWDGTGYTLAQWQTYTGQDANSTASLVGVADEANIHFIYNDTTVNMTYTLSTGMKDVYNADYSGSIYIEPFTSRILLGAGTVSEGYPVDPEGVGYPTVWTFMSLPLTAISNYVGGVIFDDGGGTITDAGICWSATANPTIADSHKTGEDFGGVFEDSYHVTITGLTGGTTYHYRAYATNESGTGYGADISFTTPAYSIGKFGTKIGIYNGKIGVLK